MKQFITVLVAALFAAASVTAIAQPKAEKMPKKEMTAEEKDKAKVKAKTAKSKTAKKKAAAAPKKDEMKK
jgi:hypothetical protein